MDNKEAQDKLRENVYVKSVTELPDALQVKGYDFDKGLDYEALHKTLIHTGF